MNTINKVLLIAVAAASSFAAETGRENGVPTQYNEATVAQLQNRMAIGRESSRKDRTHRSWSEPDFIVDHYSFSSSRAISSRMVFRVDLPRSLRLQQTNW